jgi:NitT/TauT family transport system ATP-binding protein
VVSLVGPSGCGKSTLLRLMAGLEAPDLGEVLLHGRPLLRPGGPISIIFQSYGLFPWRTALRNVEYPLRIAGMPRVERIERSRAALDRVGLTAAADKYPHQLSGGMRQRVAIARALVTEPDVMLLDEPLSALDPVSRTDLQGYLSELFHRLGCAVVLVTHDLGEAVRLADRVITLGGTPGRIVGRYDVTGEDPEPQVRLLREAMARHYDAAPD